jgi:hypothetical protein
MNVTSKTDQHDEARKVFSDIAAKNINWPELIWDAWILFEHFYGSVEQVEVCQDKIEKARYQVNIRRAKVQVHQFKNGNSLCSIFYRKPRRRTNKQCKSSPKLKPQSL